MPTVAAFRSRYARADDTELLELLAAGQNSLTPPAWDALTAESDRRGLRAARESSIVEDARDAPFVAGELPALSADAVRARRYPKASLKPRFLAHLDDCVIGIGPAFVSGIVLRWAAMRRTVFPIALLLVAGTMIWAIYYMFNKDARPGGQSIGKARSGLMVVNLETNQPCSAGESAIRAIALGITNVIPFVGWLIEPVITIASDDGRRLGDRWAGTQVIAVEMYRVDD